MHNLTSDTYGKYMCLILSEEFCKSNYIDVSRYRFQTFIEKDEELAAGFMLLEKHFYSFDRDRIIGVSKASADILYRLFTHYAEPIAPGNTFILLVACPHQNRHCLFEQALR